MDNLKLLAIVTGEGEFVNKNLRTGLWLSELTHIYHGAKKQGIEIQLTPKEFELTVFFMQNVDIALTRERLISAVWGYEYMGETRTVDTHVQQIHKKLDLQDSLITVPKLGYRLESKS